MCKTVTGAWIAMLLAVSTSVHAEEPPGAANVMAVDVTRTADGSFRFAVTISSKDTGWDGYADAFEVLSPAGDLLGKRILHHPHVDEQPFTRSLDGVEIGPDIDRVTVRAHHSTAGYDGRTRTITLPD